MPPRRPLRVVHICPRYAPARGGAELFFERLTDAVAARGDQVEVWTTTALDVAAFTRRDARTIDPGDGRADAHAWREAARRAEPGQNGGTPGGRHAAGPAWRVRRFPIRYVPGRAPVLTLAHALPLGRAWVAMTPRWGPVVPAMLRAAKRGETPCDLVHAASLPYSSVLYSGWRLARTAGARLLVTPFFHPGRPGRAGARHRHAYLSPINRWLLGQAETVFVQTEGEREALTAAGVAAERIRLVGMGVDAADCTGGDRARARARWGIAAGDVVVGHLANKSADKGTLDLIAAAESLWRAGTAFRLLLAGPSMPDFDRHAHRLMAGHLPIVNLPALDDDERRDFFAAIDLFALPSVVESFGIVILEAAANGVASIAYDAGGPASVVAHGRTGWLAPAGDIASLAGLIGDAVADAGLRARVGAQARTMSAEWTWARSIDIVLAAYDRRG